MHRKKILLVFGTRPEAIKMAPLVHQFKNSDSFDTRVCVTGQHREMLNQVNQFFNIKPDFDMNLMKPGQNLNDLTSRIISSMSEIFQSFNPDYVFVHGDTTTAMAAAISSFYNGSNVCHVEAGLRTFDLQSPFPEEMNRQVISRISKHHFAPTLKAKNNLLKENISEKNIYITGNTVIDALLMARERITSYESILTKSLEKEILSYKNVILVTGHRRENHGKGINDICTALRRIALDFSNSLIIYPVHLNPKVLNPVKSLLSDISNIELISPLNYPDFIWLMDKSSLIITDSGGVQEEAPSLGKPVLVLREKTERPEAVEAGTVKLVGTDPDIIYSATKSLLENEQEYLEMSSKINPYGDGHACSRIVSYLLDERADA